MTPVPIEVGIMSVLIGDMRPKGGIGRIRRDLGKTQVPPNGQRLCKLAVRQSETSDHENAGTFTAAR